MKTLTSNQKVSQTIITTFHSMDVSEKEQFLTRLFNSAYFIMLFNGSVIAAKELLSQVIKAETKEFKSNVCSEIHKYMEEVNFIAENIDLYKNDADAIASLYYFSQGLSCEWKYKHESYNAAFQTWRQCYEKSNAASIPTLENFL